MRAASCWLLSIACLALVWAPRVSHAEDTKVGILVSLKVNVSEAEADRLVATMASSIDSTLATSTLSGALARGKLRGPLPDTCVADPKCGKRVAGQLGVQQVLFVAVISLSKKAVQLDVTAFDAASGKAEGREMLEVDPRDPKAAIQTHVRKWLPGVPDRPKEQPTPPETTEPAAPVNLMPAPTTPDRDDGGLQISTPTWIAAGATVAALGLGTTFALMARSEFNDLEDTCPETCDKSSLKLKNRLADGFFAASAVGAGLTVYFLLTTKQSSDAPAVSIMGDSRHFAVSYQRGF